MEIKAASDEARRVLNAAAEGSIHILEAESDDILKHTRCSSGNEATLKEVHHHAPLIRVMRRPSLTFPPSFSHKGCTCLHWAAGTNQLEIIRYLVKRRGLAFVNITATKKARGRTPLHYAARNNCTEAVKLLVELGAEVDVRAKHGVSPFQLAVWQNNLDICRWLVEEQGVEAAQVNEFDCGAVHWIGISPQSQNEGGEGLLPLAKWLAEQPGVDFHKRQRQGHTPLHKVSTSTDLRDGIFFL